MTLFLFTNFFPFKKAEPFLVNEFSFTKKHFKDISILSLYGEKSDSVLKDQGGLNILDPLIPSPDSKTTLLLKGIFNLAPFHWHIKDFFFQKIFLSPKKMRWFFISLLITRSALASRSYIDLTNKISRSSDVVLYFYWGDNLCWILPYLSRQLKGRNVQIVIRFHRTDLYEELKNNYAPLREKILQEADLLCPVSEHGKNYLTQKYPQFDKKLFLSRLGVSDKGLNPQSKEKAFCVVSVSFLIPVKRVHLILEALEQINGNISWHHFGGGPMETDLNKKVKYKRYGLEVSLHGQVSNEQLMDFYKTKHVDLFINVSQSEGLPVSIMEALSFGIPVVATDAGGTADLVNNHNGTLLNTSFTIAQLSTIIEEFMKMDEERIVSFRKNARVVYEEKAGAEKNYTEFYNLITS